MNHAITLADLLRVIAGFVGIIIALAGGLTFMAGSMSDAPQAGDSAGKTGCAMTVAGIVILALALVACSTPPTRIQTVEIDKPIAVQPIKATDVPKAPAPLGPRPQSLSAAADTLLSKVCEWVAYGLRADPLLRVSAGENQAPLPKYPECEH